MKRILKALFLLALSLGVFLLFLRSDFFKVRKIECRVEKEACQAEIWNELNYLAFGKNLIFLKRKIGEEILARYPIIKDLKIKKRLPNKLIFEFKKRSGVAVLGFELDLGEGKSSVLGKPVFETAKDFYIVDEEGVVVEKENNPLLPLILLSEQFNLNIGQKVPKEEVIKAIDLLTVLRLNLFEPKVAKIISPYSLNVWLKEGVEVVLSFKKEAQIQLDSLQFILSRSKIEGKRIKKIDLRFDKPVVNYE